MESDSYPCRDPAHTSTGLFRERLRGSDRGDRGAVDVRDVAAEGVVAEADDRAARVVQDAGAVAGDRAGVDQRARRSAIDEAGRVVVGLMSMPRWVWFLMSTCWTCRATSTLLT